MDVRARPSDESKARCPYCHDLMAAQAQAEVVVCGGCGTTHHAACVEELGRCTVLGCTWTPGGAPPPALTRSVDDYRRAVAGRAHAFVRRHARPVEGRALRRIHRLDHERPPLSTYEWLRDVLGLDEDVHPERGAECALWLSLAVLAVAVAAVVAGSL